MADDFADIVAPCWTRQLGALSLKYTEAVATHGIISDYEPKSDRLTDCQPDIM